MALLSALRCTRLTLPVLCSVRASLPTVSSITLSPSLCHNKKPSVPARCYGEHNASRHWSMERYISVSMLALVPAAVMLPSTAVVDYGLAVIVPIHGHWGLQQVVTDYVHGATMNKICHALIYAVSMGTCLGLLYLNYHDVGITKAVAKLWSL